MPDKRTLEQRFWAKVDKRGPDECWPWLAGKTGEGYGQFKIGQKFERAHRIAFRLRNGDISAGYNVHHSCGRKDCVNPAHLESLPHGRHSSLHKRGAKNGRAILTPEQVVEIRQLRGIVSQVALGKRFGVTKRAICHVQLGESWNSE